MAQARLVGGNPRRAHLTAPAALVAGEVVTISNLVAVNTANPAVASGARFGADVGGGIYELTAGEAIAVGSAVFFDETTHLASEVGTDTYFGKALTATTGTGQKINVLHIQPEAAV
jgi:predicted RecA/RadA family phage recombinase